MTKVAMVSGASRGIERAIAAERERQGFALGLGIRQATLVPPDTFAPAGLASFVYEAGEPGNETAWVEATLARLFALSIEGAAIATGTVKWLNGLVHSGGWRTGRNRLATWQRRLSLPFVRTDLRSPSEGLRDREPLCPYRNRLGHGLQVVCR